MKVEIRLTQDAYEPYAVIYTNEITDEVRETADSIHASNRIVIANEDERSIVLSARDIYMIRIEDAAVWIHCKEKKYSAKKRLSMSPNRWTSPAPVNPLPSSVTSISSPRSRNPCSKR